MCRRLTTRGRHFLPGGSRRDSHRPPASARPPRRRPTCQSLRIVRGGHLPPRHGPGRWTHNPDDGRRRARLSGSHLSTTSAGHRRSRTAPQGRESHRPCHDEEDLAIPGRVADLPFGRDLRDRPRRPNGDHGHRHERPHPGPSRRRPMRSPQRDGVPPGDSSLLGRKPVVQPILRTTRMRLYPW